MAKTLSSAPSVPLILESDTDIPFYRQVYNGLRSAILKGHLGAGTRLPATRILASELGVSRNTVVTAFDQLLAEGYIEGRVGDGTYVSRVLPDELLHVEPPAHMIPNLQRRMLSQ